MFLSCVTTAISAEAGTLKSRVEASIMLLYLD